MYPSIRVSKYPSIQVSKYPSILVSKYPSIQVSKYPSIQVSKYPDIQVSKYLRLQVSHLSKPYIVGNYEVEFHIAGASFPNSSCMNGKYRIFWILKLDIYRSCFSSIFSIISWVLEEELYSTDLKQIMYALRKVILSDKKRQWHVDVWKLCIQVKIAGLSVEYIQSRIFIFIYGKLSIKSIWRTWNRSYLHSSIDLLQTKNLFLDS